MFGLKPSEGVREVDTPLDQKKMRERKLSLRYYATSSKLEVFN